MMLNIEDLKNRVLLCSEKDVFEKDGIRIYRKSIFKSWASIEVKKSSRFTRDGYAIDTNALRVTHIITMRYRHDVDISLAAWIYDEKLKSPPRWFKVNSVSDTDGIWKFECRLVENSVDASDPVSIKDDGCARAHDLPDGVAL